VSGFSRVFSSFAGLKSNISVSVLPVITASKWAKRSSILPLSNALIRMPARNPIAFAARRPNSINRFLQEPAHVTYALQPNLQEIAVCLFPMTVFLSSLPTKLGQFLRMRMKEAQPSFHSRRLA
jgi:hypothetical protein